MGHLISFSLALELGFRPLIPLGLRPSILAELHQQLSWASTLQAVKLLSLYNHTNQSLVLNLLEKDRDGR